MLNVVEYWFVVYTLSQHEKQVDSMLRRQGICSYLPLRKEIRQWSDRRKRIECPLFPNYVFVKISFKERHRVFTVPGVLKYLHIDGQPSVLSERDIDLIKVLTNENTEVIDDCLKSGDTVMITSGPLKGVTGPLVYRKGCNRLLVQISTLKRSILVEISSSAIKKLSHVT